MAKIMQEKLFDINLWFHKNCWKYVFKYSNYSIIKPIIYFAGDNILTAVSVAKECGIIEAGEMVVEVIAEEENNCNPPQILYYCGGSLLKVSDQSTS